MVIHCDFIHYYCLLFINIMPIILILVLFSFSTQAQTVDYRLAQNIEAEKALEKVVNNQSYQQICQKHSQQISLLFEQFVSLKGDVSRIYFFCEAQYNHPLTRRQRRSFQIWDIKDPVSIIECKREKLRKTQNIESNHYVINRC